jgi:hypothetical protein
MSAGDNSAPGTKSNNHENQESGSNQAGDAGSIVVWLAKHGPRWSRTPAIIAAFIIAMAPTLLLLNTSIERWAFHSAGDSAAGQLQLGAQGVAVTQSSAIRAFLNKKDLSAEDRNALAQKWDEVEHQLGHLSNPSDSEVKWIVFERTTKKDFFGYKLFPSDKCLLIARIENGQASAQWLRDPNHPVAPVGAIGPDVPFMPTLPGVPKTVLVLQSNPFQAGLVFAADRQTVDLRPTSDQTPVAQGGCLNPHPWVYRETWGAYVNQCQQPVFREWNDGCRHVQMFDHCTNTWGPVVWQVCVANHHP